VTQLDRIRRLDEQLEQLQERLALRVQGAIVTGITPIGETRTLVVAGIIYARNGAPMLWDGDESAVYLDGVLEIMPATSSAPWQVLSRAPRSETP